MEKLAAIIPPPRANQVLYAGVLAGNAALRAEVVPRVATSTEAEREARAALKLVKAEDRRETTTRAEERRCWSARPGPIAQAGVRSERLGVSALQQADDTAVDRDPRACYDEGGDRLLRSTGPPGAA